MAKEVVMVICHQCGQPVEKELDPVLRTKEQFCPKCLEKYDASRLLAGSKSPDSAPREPSGP